MSEKINNKKDAKRVYLENISYYKKALKRERLYPGSRTQRIKGFIDSYKGAEYIIFEPLLKVKNLILQQVKKTLEIHYH